MGAKGKAHSFFTPNLELLAPDLVNLLQSCSAFVDPNLLALAGKQSTGLDGGAVAEPESVGENGEKEKRASKKRAAIPSLPEVVLPESSEDEAPRRKKPRPGKWQLAKT